MTKIFKTYATGETIRSRYKGKSYTIQQVGNGRVLLKELYSWVRISDLDGVNSTSKKTTTSKSKFVVGGKVKIKSSAQKYSRANVSIPGSRKNKTYTIQQVGKDDVLLEELYNWVKKTDLQ